MSNAWELIARWPGGTVAALALVDGSVVFAATAAGLHTSSDGGQSWAWIGLGPDPVAEAVVVSSGSGTDRTVLLGTGGGVYRSGDGGTSWRPVLVGSRVQCLAATPELGGDGIVLAGTATDGLLRSEDGGLSWSGANAGLLDLDVTAAALSPSFGRDRTAFAGTASGVYRSRNGGRAWRLVELGAASPSIQALAVSPRFEDDGLVLAGTESDGLFRSDDGGQTWLPVGGFPGSCVTSLAFGPGGSFAPWVAAGTAAGVALSQDDGESWHLEAPELGPILSLTYVADDGGAALLAGTIDAGVARRDLASDGWRPANQGLAGRATVGLAVSTAYGRVPLIAVASLDAGVTLSHDAGTTWTTGHNGLESVAATSAAFAQTQVGQPRLLAAIGDRLSWSGDIETGWQLINLPTGPDARASVLSLDGDTARATSSVLVAGRECLLLSEDGGQNWRVLPLPMPRADLVGAAASPNIARDRTLYAVARATRFAADGAVEHDGLELWQTSDLGQRWTRWLHSPNATVMTLAVPRAGDLEASILVGHAGRVARPLRSAQEVRRGERRPLWQEAQIGHLQSAVTAIALSPNVRRDRTVLAAADAGVYLSRDGGATFSAWEHGLEVPLVTGLALTARADGGLEAYALGLGGTLWRRGL